MGDGNAGSFRAGVSSPGLSGTCSHCGKGRWVCQHGSWGGSASQSQEEGEEEKGPFAGCQVLSPRMLPVSGEPRACDCEGLLRVSPLVPVIPFPHKPEPPAPPEHPSAVPMGQPPTLTQPHRTDKAPGTAADREPVLCSSARPRSLQCPSPFHGPSTCTCNSMKCS